MVSGFRAWFLGIFYCLEFLFVKYGVWDLGFNWVLVYLELSLSDCGVIIIEGF